MRKLDLPSGLAIKVGGKAGVGYTCSKIQFQSFTWHESRYTIRHYVIYRTKDGYEDEGGEKWKDIFYSTGGALIEEYDPKIYKTGS
jgi:hypothetical protein